MNNNLILTVGNSMMGDDGAGPYFAQLCRQVPLPNWTALDGGTTPENFVHQIRAMKPERLMIFDATEMELPPGKIRRIDKDAIAETIFVSTHTLPLNFLIEQLEDEINEVLFIGIQPDLVAFGFPMTHAVKSAVEFFYDFLKNNGDLSEISLF
ncbi:hydrogenase maturation peptidase HycI [Aggregatibacter sp. HMT-949]|jgi:hydrogenase maturation peptidase hycI|uniref:hydrogenase maturation peptidase HycI n=1 Tax=Aggregatibacter sp. HMT-949 TaxID=3235088 RepID=UPI0010ED5927|nr:Hydrogenase 3 maturation protease [Stutzerimonas stutzeri]